MATRIDKWLWSVRLYKTRTLATNACKSGHVKINSKTAKASSEITVHDKITVRKDGFQLEFLVLQVIEKRVGAPLAVQCYDNITPEEELNKYNSWYIGKANSEIREKGSGRPTKKERREIDHFKEGHLSDDLMEDY